MKLNINMPISIIDPRRLLKQRRIAGLFALLAICAGVTLMSLAANRNWLKRGALTSFESNQTRPVNRADTILITLHPKGMTPNVLELTEGRYFLALDNLSGRNDLNLALSAERENGKLRDVRLEGKKQRWRGFFDLKQGTYLLTAAEQPDWSCRITITKK